MEGSEPIPLDQGSMFFPAGNKNAPCGAFFLCHLAEREGFVWFRLATVGNQTLKASVRGNIGTLCVTPQ